MSNLETSYMGILLKSPVILGACELTSKTDVLKRAEQEGVGAVSDSNAHVTLLSLLGADFRAAAAGARPSLFRCAARYVLDPGFAVVVRYRFSVAARRFGWTGKLLSKLIWRRNVRVSGCYLSPSSSIGPGLFLPHATAVVVGDGVAAGSNLQLYQSVTLGQRGARDQGPDRCQCGPGAGRQHAGPPCGHHHG